MLVLWGNFLLFLTTAKVRGVVYVRGVRILENLSWIPALQIIRFANRIFSIRKLNMLNLPNSCTLVEVYDGAYLHECSHNLEHTEKKTFVQGCYGSQRRQGEREWRCGYHSKLQDNFQCQQVLEGNIRKIGETMCCTTMFSLLGWGEIFSILTWSLFCTLTLLGDFLN